MSEKVSEPASKQTNTYANSSGLSTLLESPEYGTNLLDKSNFGSFLYSRLRLPGGGGGSHMKVTGMLVGIKN